jgi:hypothetical protein
LKCLLKITASVCFVFLSLYTAAQDPIPIKVRKEENLVKAEFDNVDMKLVVIDRYGNPRQNKIVSYKLWVKEKHAKGFPGFSNSLSKEMIDELKARRKATKIFFTGITAEDDEGHIVQLPDVIEVWFPECKNCEPVRKRKTPGF